MKHAGNKVSHKGRNFLIVLLILVCLGIAFKFLVYDKLMDKATDEVTESVLTSNGATSEEVQNVLDSMSAKDKATVQKIIKNHASASAIKEVSSDLSSNDTAALKEYAEKNLTDSEKEQLYALYDKYNS